VTDERDPRGTGSPGGGPERDPVTEELVRYGALTDQHPSPGFADRVMAAVEAEPTPARGGPAGAVAAWLGQLAGPARQSLRMAAVAVVVVLAVGGALVGAELSGILRNGPQAGSSTSPVISPAVTVSPTPSPTPTLEPSETPEPSVSPAESPESTATNGTGESSPPETRSPRPSASEDGGTETPHPTETPEPSQTPSPSSSSGDG
jgi:hypothetical protein